VALGAVCGPVGGALGSGLESDEAAPATELPPPGAGTFHYTAVILLVPQSSTAPAMLLVVIKGTLAPGGTISNEVVRT
jgi:hypothetical protein